jgi:hypothetical protein
MSASVIIDRSGKVLVQVRIRGAGYMSRYPVCPAPQSIGKVKPAIDNRAFAGLNQIIQLRC